MREIKFRGRCAQSGDWVYGDLIHGVSSKKGNVYILPRVENLAYVKHCDPLDGVRVDPETVGQFTGLPDSKGKDIYEGDVISSDHYPFIDEGNQNYVGVVEWIDSSWQYVMTLVNKNKRGISDGINRSFGESAISTLEVIGNIYENPELIPQ